MATDKTTKKFIEEADKVLMPTYNRYPIVLDSGQGVYLYDVEGKKYLDFASGIGVFALGYNNEEYNKSLKEQIDKIIHTSNYYYTKPLTLAANKFTEVSGMDKVFFTNSGAEAVEGAIKLARKYYYKKHGSVDSEIISMEDAFHGRTMGALSVTGTSSYREAFEPLIGGVVFADFNNIESVKSKVNDKTCAIIMEPIQGEGGIHPADKQFIKEVRQLCDDKDILLIFDEIQCGMGRTGKMFAYQDYGVEADIITSAKALGCGVPVGAFAATDRVAKAFEPGDHGTTYGGNPFAMAAVNKVLELFESEDVLANVNSIAPYLTSKLDELVEDYDSVVCRRGIGLMQGIELSIPVGNFIKKAQELGLILISAGTNVIRFLPPLIIEEEHVDQMIEILRQSFDGR